MLISQKIAKDINFLKTVVESKETKGNLFDIRIAVINSVKFIVGRELLDDSITNKEVIDRVFNKKPNHNDYSKRLELQKKYSRPVFPNIVIENDTGLFSITQEAPLLYIIHQVLPTGTVFPFYLRVDFSENIALDKALIKCLLPKKLTNSIFTPEKHSNWVKDSHKFLSLSHFIVMEILLFINTQNIRHVKYTPTKKENAMVPKPLQPKYTYHILDLFKQKKIYTSLEDIKDDLCKSRPASLLRRAVLVRGHFKQRKTGLFFWDFHTRNKHNAETHGVVDKDYRVHAPRELLSAV